MIFLPFLGIFYSLFFVVMLFYLTTKVSGFNWETQPFSDLGALDNTEKKFNVLLFLYPFFQLPFFYKLMEFYQIPNKLLVFSPFFLLFLCAFLCAIITHKKNYAVHHFFGGLGFFFGCLGGLIFASYLISYNLILGWLQILLALVVGIFLVRDYKKLKTVSAKNELTFFIGVFLWNCLNILPLLFKLNL